MEAQNNSSPPFQLARSIGLRYGGVLGLALGVFGISMHAMDWFSNRLDLGVSLPLMVVFMVLSMLALRRAQEGFMTLGQGFRVGLTTAVFATLVSAVLTHLYTGLIDPEADERALARSRERMLAEGQSLEQVNLYADFMEQMSTPAIAIPSLIITVAFIAALIALVLALILKKRPG